MKSEDKLIAMLTIAIVLIAVMMIGANVSKERNKHDEVINCLNNTDSYDLGRCMRKQP